jgi:hypothetical protein
MTPRIFTACKSTVSGRGIPPDSFLNELVDWGLGAPDEIFAPNDKPDIYGSVKAELGPWNGALHRKAVMLEALRVLAGFESSWHWGEGVDTTNQTSMTHLAGQETGIFQVSYDSMGFDPSLGDCVRRYCDVTEVQVFIDAMKQNHSFALEYCARLLRFSIAWDGPIKRHEMQPSLSRAAVAEFEGFLASVTDA